MNDYSILQLPFVVIVKIFVHLQISDLRNLMQTCKTLNDVIRSEGAIWKSCYRNKLILMNHERDLNIFNWYHRCRISNNWQKGVYRNKVIITHNTNYIPWVRFTDSHRLYLSTGSELSCYKVDKRIMAPVKQIWSLDVPKTNRMDIRTNDITRFIIKDDYLICGNRDGCMAIYELDKYTKWPHLVHYVKDCHKDGQVEVSAVEKISNTIVTVSFDSPTVCFWQIPSKEKDIDEQADEKMDLPVYCYREIQLPDKMGCKCVTANKAEDKVAVGLDGNGIPLLIDAPTGNMIWGSLIRNPYEMVRDIQWHDENSIAYVTLTGKANLIDVRTGSVVYQALDPFHANMYCVRTDSNHALVVGSSEYSRCALFDIRFNKNVQVYFTQKRSSPVYSLDFDTTKLIAAVDQGVAALNFNVNASKTQVRDYSHAFVCLCDEMAAHI